MKKNVLKGFQFSQASGRSEEKSTRGRKARKVEDVHKQVAIDTGLFSYEELVSAVCAHFCNGYPASQIIELIKNTYNVELKREDPWRMLGWAGRKGWLRAVTPLDHQLSEQL